MNENLIVLFENTSIIRLEAQFVTNLLDMRHFMNYERVLSYFSMFLQNHWGKSRFHNDCIQKKLKTYYIIYCLCTCY